MLDAGTVGRTLGVKALSPNELGGDPTLYKNIAVTHSLNAPVLTVQTTATAGDNVSLSATTNDADGATTSGVQLFNGASLVGSFTGGPSSWSYTMNGISAGTYILIARRQTNQGTVDSAPHTLVVSPSAGPADGNIQVNLPTTGVVQVDIGTGKIQDEI